jgi:hypothetical protein
LGDDRELVPYAGVGGELGHADQGPDAQAGGGEVDVAVGQRVDVDHSFGPFHGLAHQVDQGGAAGQVAGALAPAARTADSSVAAA